MKRLLPSILLCGVLATAVVSAGRLTQDRREENRLRGRAVAMSELLGVSTDRALAALAVPCEKSFPESSGILGAWSFDGKSTAVLFKGSGLWGPITAMVLIETIRHDGSSGRLSEHPSPFSKGSYAPSRPATVLRGLRIIENSETPSLGGKIAEPRYLSRFRNLGVGAGGEVEVDTITGATQTCLKFKKMLKNALGGFMSGSKGNRND